MIYVNLFLWLVLILAIYLMIRNQLVYRFQTKLLDRIHAQNMANTDKPYRWRYDELNSVSYDKMMIQFWRPLKSFYPRDPARLEK